MDSNLIFGLSFLFGLFIYILIAQWYVMPALKKVSTKSALMPILLFHSFRYIGLAFLVPGVVAAGLSPVFAVPAAYGDLLAAILALIALFALRHGWRGALVFVWIFNIEGTLDLLNAIFQGLRTAPPGLLGAAYFIPVIIVPALLVSHCMVFVLLTAKERKDTA
jgi:hypothetical protein